MSLMNSSLDDQWPLRECKGVHVLGTFSWDFMLFPGCTALYKDTKDGFGTWQHLHILKVQAHLDAKERGKKQIEISLKSLKDSAKRKCHNWDNNHLENKFKGP